MAHCLGREYYKKERCCGQIKLGNTRKKKVLLNKYLYSGMSKILCSASLPFEYAGREHLKVLLSCRQHKLILIDVNRKGMY